MEEKTKQSTTNKTQRQKNPIKAMKQFVSGVSGTQSRSKSEVSGSSTARSGCLYIFQTLVFDSPPVLSALQDHQLLSNPVSEVNAWQYLSKACGLSSCSLSQEITFFFHNHCLSSFPLSEHQPVPMNTKDPTFNR